jgi:phospholipid/cholesterol/gamma-HCH transport system ATP-binding protein
MGYVFQNAALFDSLTVEDNVLFGVRRKERLSRSREQEILSRYLEAVSLAGVEKFYPHQLSGGMQKRVGLARALAMEPEIIFYDEPTSGLDPSVAYSIDELIVRTRDSLGVTSIVVTHDLRSAARIADRVAFLEEGKISFLGSFEDLSKSPSETIQRLLQLTDSKKLKVS